MIKFEELIASLILPLVAHPDDETLGAGASIWKWTHSGDIVDVDGFLGEDMSFLEFSNSLFTVLAPFYLDF